ncbi:site-specific integrase [Propylenella binzhouense]|uniref:site-specific integrase n=1 Tax=Propylenella binzhouense TaxID=2555902 RepID=UPI001369BE22|nr:site-specific integrase [Propylenella binzhouense]
MTVPADVRPILGKRELLELIGTDRMTAIRSGKHAAAVARLKAQIDAARRQPSKQDVPRPRRGRRLSARDMALQHYADQTAFDAEIRDSDPRFAAMDGIDEGYVARLRRVIAGAAPDQEIQATVGWIMRKFADQGTDRLEPGSSEWRSHARTLATAELESLARTAERDEGDFTGTPTHPIFTQPAEKPEATDPHAARIVSDESLLTLDDLLPKFLKERAPSPAMQHEHIVSTRMFNEFLGGPRPVYAITRRDVNAYKNALLDTPTNASKRFPGLTLPEAIEANKQRPTPFPTLTARTVADKWLQRLHAIFAWCAGNDIIPDNPASGVQVRYKKDKSKPPRVPFTPGDLSAIFGPPAFAPGKALGETEWAMLISLFAGTRPSELAQMRLDSVRHVRGVLAFTVEEETKNAGSRRTIPVHRTLVELGLAERVAELRKAGATHLFPEWYDQGMRAKRYADAKAEAEGRPPTLNQHFPKYLPKRVNNTYLPKVGVKERGKDFYSFRHTFKTGLALAGVEKSIRDQLCGHADSSAGATYEHDVSVEALKQGIDRLYYDGLDLSALA